MRGRWATRMLILAGLYSFPALAQVNNVDQICDALDDPCLIDRTIEVASGADLDFGTRAVQITSNGSLVLPSDDTMYVTCGSFRIDTNGSIEAKGSSSQSGSSVTVSADTSLSVSGEIDISGNSAGSLSLSAGTVTIVGIVRAQGIGQNATGGDVTIEATEAVSISGKVLASAGAGGAGADGGTLQITSAGTLELSDTSLVDLDGSGFGQGGEVTIDAQKAVILRGTVAIAGGSSVDGGGDGGTLELQASENCQLAGTLTATSGSPEATGGVVVLLCDGTVTVSGTIDASGRGSYSYGGEISITGTTALSIAGQLLVKGGSDGDGGLITLDSDGAVQFSESTVLRADGSGEGYGGDIEAGAGEQLTIRGTISTTGGTDADGGGDGGAVELITTDNCQMGATITATSGSPEATGGSVTLSCDGNAAVSGNIDTSGKGASSGGGDISVTGTTTLIIGGELLAEGGADGDGGVIELDSNGALQFSQGAAVRADGSGLGSGGSITVDGLETLTIEGTVSADSAGGGGSITINRINGSSTQEIVLADTAVVSANGGRTTPGGSLSLRGCLVTIVAGGRATATGVGGSILVTGANRIDIGGILQTDAVSGSIELVYRDFRPILRIGSQFTPDPPTERAAPLLLGCEALPPTPTGTLTTALPASPTRTSTSTPGPSSTPTASPTRTSTPGPTSTPTASPTPAGPGDTNCDGAIDVLDLSALAEVIFDQTLLQRCELANLDVNGNGAPDAADFPALISILGARGALRF